MSKTATIAISTLLFGACAISAFPAARPEPPLKHRLAGKAHIAMLEKRIPELMALAGVPGMSIALIEDGRVVWSRGFGVRSSKTGQPVGERTAFVAASLTKPFFACLAMKLVEAGQIDLDRPLVTYAPADVIAGNFLKHPLDAAGFQADRFAKITARMVLSHSSGLPHGGPRNPMPILFAPGEKFRYSAEGYEYLQRVLEHVTGKPLAELARELLIGPLGMKDSAMAWEDSLAADAVVGHDLLGATIGEFRKRTQAHAAASLYTTAADYGRFVAALMDGRLLLPKTTAAMLAPQVAVKENLSWSLGFGIERTGGGTAFWQWGDDQLFRNYIVAYPEKRTALVYLTNSQNGLAIGQALLDLAIGGGRDQGLAFLNYERHDSPAGMLLRAARDRGVEAALRLFREACARDPRAFANQDLNMLGYALMGGGRIPEAVAALKANAEAFPDLANVWDSLAEACMKGGDDEQALRFYRKAVETAGSDKRSDPAFLERLVQEAGATAERLEKRLQRRLGKEEAAKLYGRFCGDFLFEIPGVGAMTVRVFVADGLFWGKAQDGIAGDRAEFIPVAGKPLEFELDSPTVGMLDWEFLIDGQGAVVGARFFQPQMNLRAEGIRK